MDVNLEDMTLEQFLTWKADRVEKAIMDHCQKMVDMIKAEFESSRAKELGEMEGQTSNRTEMRVCLNCVKGPHKDQNFPLHLKSKVYPIIGRTTSADVLETGVSLSKDREVSSYHGKFFLRAGQLKYKDTNSLNHSYVNDDEVTTDVTLMDGDRLRVGQSELIVSIIK